MKKEIAKKWVNALRSGKYQQGRLRLEKDGKFCCLGVLCDILEIPKKDDGSGDGLYYGKEGWVAQLPPEATELSGITSKKRSDSHRGNFDKSQRRGKDVFGNRRPD